jgi:hypothetical protein
MINIYYVVNVFIRGIYFHSDYVCAFIVLLVIFFKEMCDNIDKDLLVYPKFKVAYVKR